ncbi:hypothetical protein H5410_062056 [Solanum commersonii]|uniref:Transmembrane protein n=1 Tax=Solanum commersonii TaxID=4109 RepID=A0A9J5W9Q0_SOLCO|nr:hypothetical protein H5410_062056 [Solanum commersonii]
MISGGSSELVCKFAINDVYGRHLVVRWSPQRCCCVVIHRNTCKNKQKSIKGKGKASNGEQLGSIVGVLGLFRWLLLRAILWLFDVVLAAVWCCFRRLFTSSSELRGWSEKRIGSEERKGEKRGGLTSGVSFWW